MFRKSEGEREWDGDSGKTLSVNECNFRYIKTLSNLIKGIVQVFELCVVHGGRSNLKSYSKK